MEWYKSRLCQDGLLLLVVSVGYIAWRSPADVIWDDSLAICENVEPGGGISHDSFADPAFFTALWRRDFGSLHLDGYRPLNWVIRRIGSAWHHDSASAGGFLVVLNGLLAGLLAVSFCRLTRRFTSTRGGALLAVFFLLASTPILTGLLVLFAGIQTLVPLSMCVTLHCYFAALETRRRWPWLLSMGLLLVVMPLYREFAGLTSLLILFLELQRGRWRSGVSLLAAVTFVHALFPTALPHYLWFPDLPVQPVYQFGVLEKQLQSGVPTDGTLLSRGREAIASLKGRIFLDLLSILPPTLYLLAAAGWGWAILRQRAPAIAGSHAAFLGFFFLLTFLPFLKVFREQVHLAYCLVPACIILAASVEVLWREVGSPRGLRLLVGGLLLVAMADHALNLWVVRRATRECYAAMDRVAQHCAREMPLGSLLLCNTRRGLDVQLRAGGQFVFYAARRTSVQATGLVRNNEFLETFLREAGRKDIYYLEVWRPNPQGPRPTKPLEHVLRASSRELQDLGEIGHLSYRFAPLDPLKLLLPQRNMAWPCSPDLEVDYYRGPALDGTPWLREIAASYHLYRIRDQGFGDQGSGSESRIPNSPLSSPTPNP
jgi:hypothetical protein